MSGTGRAPRLLLVEDSRSDAFLVRQMVAEDPRARFEVVHATSLAGALPELGAGAFLCVVLDLGLPDASGLEALAAVLEAVPSVPVVVLTAWHDDALGVKAVQAGAQDYLVKGEVTPSLLSRAIHYAVERKHVEEQLAHAALHDALTGLPNRHLFLDRLDQALARLERKASKVAVLFLDLDRFKTVNDSLGHDVGDELLVAVATRLRHLVRESDTIARFGGDEFTILCDDLAEEQDAVDAAERILEGLTTPFSLGEHSDVVVTTSIGISWADGPTRRAVDLLRDADVAMYRAK